MFTQLNAQIFLTEIIQFNISHLLVLSLNGKSVIWPIDRTLSGATTPGQSGPGSDGNEEILCIPPKSSITGVSPLDCLVSYPGHPLESVLPFCRDAVGVFYRPGPQGFLQNHIEPVSLWISPDKVILKIFLIINITELTVVDTYINHKWTCRQKSC